MTIALTIGGAIALIVLLASGASTMGTAAPPDRHPRGSWGVLAMKPRSDRSLDPHERRWQTALISGKDSASRWPDVVAEIAALERLAHTDPVGPAPENFDRLWIEASIRNLEQSLEIKQGIGDSRHDR